MREAKKILSYIKRFYPKELEVFESMNARDRKHSASLPKNLVFLNRKLLKSITTLWKR